MKRTQVRFILSRVSLLFLATLAFGQNESDHRDNGIGLGVASIQAGTSNVRKDAASGAAIWEGTVYRSDATTNTVLIKDQRTRSCNVHDICYGL